MLETLKIGDFTPKNAPTYRRLWLKKRTQRRRAQKILNANQLITSIFETLSQIFLQNVLRDFHFVVNG